MTPAQENGNGRELSRGVGGGEKRAKTGGGGAAIKAASAKSGIIGFSIAKVGNTGRSTGPHLHWGIRIFDSRVDPFSLVSLPLQ